MKTALQTQLMSTHKEELLSFPHSLFPQSYPFLSQGIFQGFFCYLDAQIALTILKTLPEKTEEIAVFIAYLASCLQAGHVSCQLQKDTISPDPVQHFSSLLVNKNPDLISDKGCKDWLASITDYVLQGASSLAYHLTLTTSIVLDNSRYYFHAYYTLQNRCFSLLASHIAALPTTATIDVSSLNEEQEQAVKQALASNFHIICGGPGTGKTHTAAYLVQALIAIGKKSKTRLLLAAPTGKAACKLRSSIETRMQKEGQADPIEIESGTLHALLRYKSSSTPSFLHADVLIVDECSMIDLRLMLALFESLAPQTRLYLIGDPDQLPPVEVGAPFNTLVSTQANHVSTLASCLRIETKDILKIAHGVREGNKAVFDTISVKSLKDVKQLSSHYAHYFPQTKEALTSSAASSFCILSPLKKGPFGVDNINQAFLQKQLQENLKELVLPIVITKNNYTLALFNGEHGYLCIQKTSVLSDGTFSFQKGDRAYFFEEGKTTELPALLLSGFELGYAITVHKSQGSEFDKVALVLSQGAQVFGKKVLYTAITRAKKTLTIWGERRLLQDMIQKS